MSTSKLPNNWSKDSLLNKAQRYASVMLKQKRDDWQFCFWSALTLELLARAALANISPALLADVKDWNNIYYALGHQPTAKKFVPKSTRIQDILTKLEAILPKFTKEMLNFSILHLNRRNSEVHSGELPFDSLGTSEWLGIYYLTCCTLLESLDENLQLLFGINEEELAKTLIKSLKDDAAKAVNGTINTHHVIWEGKSKAEQDTLRQQAETFSSRKIGHCVPCPSCGCTGILHGTPIDTPTYEIKESLIVQQQTLLPSDFECVACSLKISGFSKLNACGLGNSFTETSHYDATDYFNPPDESHFEDDFNEYGV